MQKTSKIPDRIVFSGIVFLLIFAPLAFGSVHVWAYAAIEIIVFALLGIFCVGRILTQPRFEWVKTPANGFLILLLVLIGIQWVPMPRSWTAAVSPKTVELRDRADAVLSDVRIALGQSPTDDFSRLSRFFSFSSFSRLLHSPHPAMREGLKLAGYLAMFFLTINALDSVRRMHILVLVVVFLGLFEALYAIGQVFGQNPAVWWWKSRAGGGRYATGTFIGSNHFAGYMEMAFCMTWGYALTLKTRTGRMVSGLGGWRAGVQRVLGWFSPESARPLKLFFLFAAAVMGLALMLSASRGAILSVCSAMAVTAGLFWWKTKKLRFAGAILAMGLLTLGYALFVGIDPTLEKFENTQSFHDRMAVSRTLAPMIADYPAAGVGWGNFPDIYPRYAVLGQNVAYYNGYAHNDWLEAATELGLAGAALMVLAYGACLMFLIRIWKRRNNAFAVGIGAGVLAAAICLGLHSLVDFNMHIPANPLTLAALFGLGGAAVHHRGNDYTLSFLYRKGGFAAPRPLRIMLAVLIAGAAVLMIRPAASHLVAEIICPTEHNSTLNLEKDLSEAAVIRAVSWSAQNPQYHRRLARIARDRADALENPKDQALDYDRAAASLVEALGLSPSNALAWHDLADLYLQRKGDGYAYLTTWVPLADRCFDMAVFCAPYSRDILFNAAWHGVWRAGLLPVDMTPGVDMTRDQGIEKFQDMFQRYLSQNPGHWKRCVERVRTYFPDDAVVLGIVPEENEDMMRSVLTEIVKRET